MIRDFVEHRPETPIEGACALLGVSRSQFYYQPADRREAEREAARLRADIEAMVLEMAGYGYRRVTKQLRRDGWHINAKRVLRVMREESLLCQLQRRWVPTTDSDHGLTVYPNLLKTTVVERLDQVWVADITYIRLPGGFCYLAAILDAHSRRVVGWQLSDRIDTNLALDALGMALGERCPPSGLVHHSDRGVQYASGAYIERLEQAGALVSMSAKGRPRDNAKAESFFRTLKVEEVYLNDYENLDHARRELRWFIEDVYNQKRLHSSLGYVPPCEFEANQTTCRDAMCVR